MRTHRPDGHQRNTTLMGSFWLMILPGQMEGQVSPVSITPSTNHAVEEEVAQKILFQCELQKDAIGWPVSCGATVNVHRESNRKQTVSHNQFR